MDGWHRFSINAYSKVKYLINGTQQLFSCYMKCSECKLPRAFGLVDYSKFFDYIGILELIIALKGEKVEQIYVNLLQHI